jgi:outer membrane biosynthesis protein TonB
VTKETTAERQDRQFRRALRVGMVASLLFHVAVFLFFRENRIPPSSLAAAGPDADDDEAAAGGALVNVRITEPQPIPRPPEPVFVPDLEVPVEPQPEVEVEQVDVAALTPGTGDPAETPGSGDATGEGDAGTGDEGRFRVVPPNPRGMILPPSDAPRSARGREITIYVFVSDRGRVVADSTRVIPSSGNRGYDRNLVDRANEWIFEPARRDGRAVGEWFNYSFTVGS